MISFNYFALGCLHYWLGIDRRFVAGLCTTKNTKGRLDSLKTAAYEYGVARNFKTRAGGNFNEGDYAGYRQEWLNRFAKCEGLIRSACAELVGIKNYWGASLTADEDAEITRSTWEQWFHEGFLTGCSCRNRASYHETSYSLTMVCRP